MILRTLLPCLLLTLFLCTCDRAQNTTDNTASAGNSTLSAATSPYANFESLPLDRLQHIFSNATYLDATFYDIPASINQNERAQIQSTMAGIGRDPMKTAANCEPIGHIWFQIDGENIEEADIYFQTECVGYVWYEDGKPAYSNAMTEQGAQFYLSIFQSVEQKTGQ